MFLRISNVPRDYAWGARGAISDLLGFAPNDGPEAELWLGAHHGSPSHIVDPALVGGVTDLARWIDVDHSTALGGNGMPRLPFLLKVLAAGAPLSLQVHPDVTQAAEGFAREQAAGIPNDAPHRNYRDDSDKPEILLAVSETFEALCGFRPAAELLATISRLAELAAAPAAESVEGSARATVLEDWRARVTGDDALGDVLGWLLSGDAASLVEIVVAIAREHPREFPLVVTLADAYPGDPGAVIALMLNHVELRAGEALHLPPRVIHSYLRGVGIELMASSDNVLRGGLTPKHVDVAELLAVLDANPGPVPYLEPFVLSDAMRAFRPAGAGFQLVEATGAGVITLSGPAIALCTHGSFALVGAASAATLGRGDAAYITPDEVELAVRGEGMLYLATGR